MLYMRVWIDRRFFVGQFFFVAVRFSCCCTSVQLSPNGYCVVCLAACVCECLRFHWWLYYYIRSMINGCGWMMYVFYGFCCSSSSSFSASFSCWLLFLVVVVIQITRYVMHTMCQCVRAASNHSTSLSNIWIWSVWSRKIAGECGSRLLHYWHWLCNVCCE